MQAWLRRLRVLALGAPGLACAALPCTGWESSASTLQRHGPDGRIVFRAAPQDIAALRRSLLSHCDAPDRPHPPLDIGPVDVEADLHGRPQGGDGTVELQLRMRADRLLLEAR